MGNVRYFIHPKTLSMSCMREYGLVVVLYIRAGSPFFGARLFPLIHPSSQSPSDDLLMCAILRSA